MQAMAVMVQMQMMRVPSDREIRGHAPEETRRPEVTRGVGVVVERIGDRVVTVNRPRLVDDNLGRLIDRDIDDLGVGRPDLDDVAVIGNDLPVVGAEIAGEQSAAPEVLRRSEHGRLVGQHGFAERPGPVDIVVHQAQDLGVVEQRDDRFVPGLVGLERRILLEIVEEAGGPNDVERESRCRQNDPEQVIGIERDRRDELFEIVRVKGLGSGRPAEKSDSGQQEGGPQERDVPEVRPIQRGFIHSVSELTRA